MEADFQVFAPRPTLVPGGLKYLKQILQPAFDRGCQHQPQSLEYQNQKPKLMITNPSFLVIFCVINIYPQLVYDRADLGLTGFSCTIERSEDVSCSPPNNFSPMYYITRTPRPLPPTTSLIRIYTSECWFYIFLCIFCVSVFCLAAGKIGTYYGVGTSDYVDISLVPFR